MGPSLGWVCSYKDFLTWMLTSILLPKYTDSRVYCSERAGHLIFYISKPVAFSHSFTISTCVLYSGQGTSYLGGVIWTYLAVWAEVLTCAYMHTQTHTHVCVYIYIYMNKALSGIRSWRWEVNASYSQLTRPSLF